MKTSGYLTLIFFCLNTVAFSQCPETVYTGDATYYDYQGGGNCSFPNPYSDLPSAALNAPQYKNADLCGACAEVTGPRGKFLVSIEDQCPECQYGDLDFEKDAFPLIADHVVGRLKITWKIVGCPVSGPVVLHFKKGSHQWWSAVQVRNSRFPVKKFEYKTSSGAFKEIPRENYNYFIEASGMGPGPYHFRITDILGQVIEAKNIAFAEDQDVAGQEQFPDCGTITETADPETRKNSIWPNPASEKNTTIFNIKNTPLNYQIMDMTGTLIESGTIPSASEKLINFPATGTYLIRYENGNEFPEVKKIVVY
jgi:expansin